jgi:hypothetical protein
MPHHPFSSSLPYFPPYSSSISVCSRPFRRPSPQCIFFLFSLPPSNLLPVSSPSSFISPPQPRSPNTLRLFLFSLLSQSRHFFFSIAKRITGRCSLKWFSRLILQLHAVLNRLFFTEEAGLFYRLSPRGVHFLLEPTAVHPTAMWHRQEWCRLSRNMCPCR